jgi:hypothetical protein
VRRILSVLLEALGRPIGYGCWVDPTMRGRANTVGSVEVECPPEHHDHRMPIAVIVEPSTRETFSPGELADAYEKFMNHGPQYLDAETGIEGSVYRFGARVLVVYEEIEPRVVVLIHPIL